MIISLDKFKRNVGPSEPGSGGTGIDFSVIGYGKKDSVNATSIAIEPVEYSKSLYEKWDPATTDATSYFWKDDNLVYAPAVDTSNVTSFYCMFDKCHNLKYAPQYNFANATDISYMFRECEELIEAPEIDLTNVTHANGAFNGCSKLKEITFVGSSENLNPDIVYNLFDGCNATINVQDDGTNDNIISIAQKYSGSIEINRLMPKTAAIFKAIDTNSNSYIMGALSLDTFHALYNGVQYPIYYQGDGQYKVTLPDENSTAELYFGGSKIGDIETGKEEVTINGELYGERVSIVNDWNNILFELRNVSVGPEGVTLQNYGTDTFAQFAFYIPVPAFGEYELHVGNTTEWNQAYCQCVIYASNGYGSYRFNDVMYFGPAYDSGSRSTWIDRNDLQYDNGQYYIYGVIGFQNPSENFTIPHFELINLSVPELYNDATLRGMNTILADENYWYTNAEIPVYKNYYLYDGRCISKFSLGSGTGDGRCISITCKYTETPEWVQSSAEKIEFQIEGSDARYIVCDGKSKETMNLPYFSAEIATKVGLYESYVPKMLSNSNIYMGSAEIVDNKLRLQPREWCVIRNDSNLNKIKMTVTPEVLGAYGRDENNLPVSYIFVDNYGDIWTDVEGVVSNVILLFNKGYEHYVDVSIEEIAYPYLDGYNVDNPDFDNCKRFKVWSHATGDIATYDEVASIGLNLAFGQPDKEGRQLIDWYLNDDGTIDISMPIAIAMNFLNLTGCGTEIFQIMEDTGEWVNAGYVDYHNTDIWITPKESTGKDEYCLVSPATGIYQMSEVKDGWYKTSLYGIDDYVSIAKNYDKETGEAEKTWGLNEKEYYSGPIIGSSEINVKYPAGENGFTITASEQIIVWFNESENLIAFTDTDDYDSMINIEISK